MAFKPGKVLDDELAKQPYSSRQVALFRLLWRACYREQLGWETSQHEKSPGLCALSLFLLRWFERWQYGGRLLLEDGWAGVIGMIMVFVLGNVLLALLLQFIPAPSQKECTKRE